MFLTFKTANGSGWLTSHRLILCKHPPGQIEGHPPEDYWLKFFEDAQTQKSVLTIKFQNKNLRIEIPAYSPSLLQEIKNFIEEAAKNWKARIVNKELFKIVEASRLNESELFSLLQADF
jgi:hypothetical protein